MRYMFLFGAGASVGAKLPMANELTNKVITHFQTSNESGADQVLAVLQYVYYGLLFEESKTGNLQVTADIERLLNVVGALAQKENLDLDAFITAWDPAIDGLNQFEPHRFSGGNGLHRFAHEVENTFNRFSKGRHVSASTLKRTLEQAIIEVSGVIPRTVENGAFKQTMEKTVLCLKTLLKVEEKQDLSYLSPIKDFLKFDPVLTIATLNYDKVIETFCSQNQIVYSTGLTLWSKEFEVKPPQSGLFLIKLHGSLDWEIEQGYNGHFKNFRLTEDEAIKTMTTRQAEEAIDSKPAIIFGQRDKLTADGPFLDLLRAFRDQLFTAITL